MPFRPQSEKLAKLHLIMHHCGRLMSDKPGSVCKRCGPDTEATPQKVCKRGHSRVADQKRCAECDRERKQAKRHGVDRDGPVTTDTQRAENAEAAASRRARRAGLGLQAA